jgi:hypothetical protein
MIEYEQYERESIKDQGNGMGDVGRDVKSSCRVATMAMVVAVTPRCQSLPAISGPFRSTTDELSVTPPLRGSSRVPASSCEVTADTILHLTMHVPSYATAA